MFIGVYELEGKEKFNIYHYRNSDRYRVNEWEIWLKDTFSPNIKNIRFLDFKISGENYEERKASLEDLAKEWQSHFSQYSWSYGELAEIEDYFYKNGKRYGLLKVFKENCIC